MCKTFGHWKGSIWGYLIEFPLYFKAQINSANVWIKWVFGNNSASPLMWGNLLQSNKNLQQNKSLTKVNDINVGDVYLL